VITAGLGCDGETIALTGASQPSLEDLVLGGIPWVPKVNLYNPLLAPKVGDDFLEPFHRAADGRLTPFILVVEGSIPDEGNKAEGYWAAFGTDSRTGQPITTCEWIDRLAPRAWAVMAVGTCATYAMAGNTPDVGIVTKLDLATAVEFDWPAAQRSLEAVRPGMRILKLSAKTGEGMDEWWQLLESLKAAVISSASPFRSATSNR